MFSEMIQGLLSSGGQANAMKRYTQMTNYINGVPAKADQAALQKSDVQLPNASSVQSFDKVLQSTAKAQFGTLLKNRGISSVDASIYTNPAVNFNKRATRDEIISMIDETSAKYGVDSKLIKALVKQESGFNPNAKSKAGALGLMQLMPSTAKGLGVTDPLDAKQNIEGGVKYVKSLLDRFNGNVILALAAYNAGPNAVKKYDGVPPYKETQNYVKAILSNYL
jgi:soluble lytic murein transglycosylase-like protein